MANDSETFIPKKGKEIQTKLNFCLTEGCRCGVKTVRGREEAEEDEADTDSDKGETGDRS